MLTIDWKKKALDPDRNAVMIGSFTDHGDMHGMVCVYRNNESYHVEGHFGLGKGYTSRVIDAGIADVALKHASVEDCVHAILLHVLDEAHAIQRGDLPDDTE